MLAYFFFYFIKISFPVHFLFKWKQNLSARPRMTEIYSCFSQLLRSFTATYKTYFLSRIFSSTDFPTVLVA